MPEINMLCDLPKPKRNLKERNEAQELQRDVALKFGKEYFDGDRTQGYGGYRYDGRWIPVAKRFVATWGLKPGDKVLDIGCAKGFLVKDLLAVCPGLEVYGIDISKYAIENCEPEAKGRVQVADARELPFADKSFKAAICINTVHNFPREECKRAIQEILRVSTHHSYIQVDAYYTPEEKEIFEKWQLTCKCHMYPKEWEELFKSVGYNRDYYWTVIS